MKEILLGMAEYNRKVDEALIGIFQASDESLLREDQGAFYRSALGTLEHVFLSYLTWLRRFRGFFDYPSLGSSRLLSLDAQEVARQAAESPARLYALLKEVDALLLAFVGELDEVDLLKRVRYKNARGEELEKVYWHTVFHVLNHAVHHRGEISVLLDRKGIKNDFSGFTLYTS